LGTIGEDLGAPSIKNRKTEAEGALKRNQITEKAKGVRLRTQG
jgi:hypothetical protein